MADLSPKEAALRIIRRLVEHDHTALLAGGCVRDMLLGHEPTDYDVATDAPPERVIELFRRTRRVGEQFGVVLVKQGRGWTEVATFRTDLGYQDGRHPTGVVFSTPQEDAKRRDFTINGMFYDPLTETTIDYVEGQEDLRRGIIRAIGNPTDRFAEDSLRMLRAVRFAARLSFTIEPVTQAAIVAHAADVGRVSAERIREELEKMLTHPTRANAVARAGTCTLLDHLWPDAAWSAERTVDACDILGRLPDDVSFPTALAGLLEGYSTDQVNRICRDLTCSNDQRKTVTWLTDNQSALVDPHRLTLADLKLLMQHPAFDDLLNLFRVRLITRLKGLSAYRKIRHRADAIPADAVAPPPLLTGDDLIAMGYEPSPAFGPVLNTVYRAQLDEEITERDPARDLARRLLAKNS
jgi:poly(A) polymerase